MERNFSKDITVQRHALADVCNVDILINISENSQKSTCIRSVFNEVAGLQPTALLQKRPQRRDFPVNLRIFKKTFFYRTLPGGYF